MDIKRTLYILKDGKKVEPYSFQLFKSDKYYWGPLKSPRPDWVYKLWCSGYVIFLGKRRRYENCLIDFFEEDLDDEALKYDVVLF